MNKRWKYNKYINKHELYFTQFYDELIAELQLQDDNWYQYYFINDYLPKVKEFDSLEEAKNYVEKDYIQTIEKQINFLKDRIDKFKMKEEINETDMIEELEMGKYIIQNLNKGE